MPKWEVRYTIVNNEGVKTSKTTDIYGVNPFDAYCNANKLLSIIERGNTITKIEVVTYR